MKKTISNEKAKQLIQELNLVPGDSFSNSEPSDLCSEYRMETGYWHDAGNSRLVHRVTTNEDSKYETTSYLELNHEALGLEKDEENSPEKVQTATKILEQVSTILGEVFDLKNI